MTFREARTAWLQEQIDVIDAELKRLIKPLCDPAQMPPAVPYDEFNEQVRALEHRRQILVNRKRGQ